MHGVCEGKPEGYWDCFHRDGAVVRFSISQVTCNILIKANLHWQLRCQCPDGRKVKLNHWVLGLCSPLWNRCSFFSISALKTHSMHLNWPEHYTVVNIDEKSVKIVDFDTLDIAIKWLMHAKMLRVCTFLRNCNVLLNCRWSADAMWPMFNCKYEHTYTCLCIMVLQMHMMVQTRGKCDNIDN